MRSYLAGSIIVVAAMLAFSTVERPRLARAARQEPIKAADIIERTSLHRP